MQSSHIYTQALRISQTHTQTLQYKSHDRHTHTQTHTTPVWSYLCLPGLEQIIGGGVNCGILKLTLSVTLCQLCISLYQTHTFAPSLLKQHREQGLWIINTRKVPHNSVHRCPSGKQCWCVEQESHGRSPGEYKIHVQTQTRTDLADF